MSQIRTFIAIEINEKDKIQLLGLISKLKEAGSDIKWVNPNAMHLTLKFLGNIDKSLIEKLKILLDDISKKYSLFEMRLAGISAFPNLNRPRVLWIGIDKGSSLILEIQKELEEKLHTLGFEKEGRGFTPHLTLGRVRSFKNFERLKPLLEDIKFQGESDSEARGIILFQSTLTAQGPIYTKLHEVSFLKT